MWILGSPLWCSPRLPNSEILIAQNNAFFIATARVAKDSANATDWEVTMGILLVLLRVLPSVQVHMVARRTNGVSREVKK